MTSALTPLALQNADLLRALDAGGFGTAADLARKMGRDRANFRKTLLALADADLVDMDQSGRFPIPVLKAAGREALAALARAEGAGQAAEAPEGHAFLLHPQIAPDPLNPRKEFDPEGIAELAQSIARDGLLENLVVRAATGVKALLADPPQHRLVAGERRWRAVGSLIADGRWPADRPLLCKVVDIDDAAHRRLALVENLQRKDLRPIDEAAALKELMAVTGAGTAEVARDIGFTQRFVQQRLQLLELPQIQRAQLNSGEITIEDARRFLADRPRQLELAPAETLVLLEVAWAIAAKSNNAWTTVACDHAVHADAAELVAKKLLKLSGPDYEGHDLVRAGDPAWNHLMALTGGQGTLVRAALEPHVRAARKAALGDEMEGRSAAAQIDALFKTKRFLTPWLNPPFAIDPEVLADREARERREASWQAEREAQQQAAQAQREAKERGLNEARSRGRQWLADVHAFEDAAAGLDHAAFTAAFAALLERYEIPAPYAITWREAEKDAQLIDAKGAWFAGLEAGLEARRRLLCIALNYAAGCAAVSGDPLPNAWPSDEPEPDEGEEDDQVQFLDEDDEEGAEHEDEAEEGEIPSYLARLAAPPSPAEAP